MKEKKREDRPADVKSVPTAPIEQAKLKRSKRRSLSEDSKERARLRALQYYYEHREERIAYQKRYSKSESGKQLRREFEKKYIKTEKYKSWLREYRLRKREEKNKQQLIPTV